MELEEIEELIIEVGTKIDYIESTPVMRHLKHIKFRDCVKNFEIIKKVYKDSENLEVLKNELEEIEKTLNILMTENNIEIVTNIETLD